MESFNCQKLNKQNKFWKIFFKIFEYEIPLFQGEFEKYGDLFKFMDVPGLNEESDINKILIVKYWRDK